MKCKLIGLHLRVFSKAIRLLSKISDMVLITTNSNEMKLQSVSEQKTTFVEIKFEKRFFSSFESEVENLCQISIKSLILVFRVVNIDKIVDCCDIFLDNSMPRVVFQMKCKKGVSREYFLPFMDSDVFRYSSNYVNKSPTFKANSKVLSEAFQHFAQSTKDITLWIQSNQILFKSFFEEDEQNDIKYLTTTFAYKSCEFTNYNFTGEISTTFNFRDLKAFLELASFQKLYVDAYFEASGKPIEFTINNTIDFYSAKTMLATFDFPEDELPEPPSNQLSNNSLTILGSDETNHELNNNSNVSQTPIQMPSHIPDSSPQMNTSLPINFSNVNSISNQTEGQPEDQDEDIFDDDEELEELLKGMPDFSRIASPESQQISVRTNFTLTGSPLRRYHQNILNFNEEEDNFVPSTDDLLVPDSDEEIM